MEDESPVPDYFRITTTGAYHVKRLLDMFVYADSIIVDTPILDSAYRDKIKDVSLIDDRIDRVRIFMEYIDKKWADSGIKVSGFDWKDHSSLVKEDMKVIHSRVHRDHHI